MKNSKVKYIYAGMLSVSSKNIILKTSPLGSCIAVIIYDPNLKLGGLAHIMFSGNAPVKTKEKNKYSENAINSLLSRLKRYGSNIEGLEIVVAGAANVMRSKNDTIVRDNIEAVSSGILIRGLKIRKLSVGGFRRRTLELNLGKRVVFETLGDNPSRIIYRLKNIAGKNRCQKK